MSRVSASLSLPAAADLSPDGAPFSASAAPVQGGPGRSGVSPVGTGENVWALVAVGLFHWVLLAGLTHSLSQRPVAVVPPALIGLLVSAPPVTPPQPLPRAAQARPVPRLVARPQAVAPLPLPVAEPSERAVTAPPPSAAPATTEPMAAAPAVQAPSPTPLPVSAPEPVVPPRSDAAHLNNPAPTYPPVSRRLGEQGRVQLDVYILADGSVGEIKLRRSSGYSRLDQAALEAVRQWRYQPARRGNEAIPFWYVQPLNFSLDS